MKIKVGVRCQYWDRSESVEFEMPDEASEEEIENAAREAALEHAHFNWWIE
jgi:hypothetical protein